MTSTISNGFRTALVAAALVLLPGRELLAGPERAATRPQVTCRAAVQHPIDVRIEALDPISRGTPLRLRMTATSAVEIERAEVRLTSPGGVSVLSSTRATLGRLAPTRTRTADFTATLPQNGSRFLLQFSVAGEGPSGPISRGATFNLLPDGPDDPGRVVTSSRSGALVHEFAARRIDR